MDLISWYGCGLRVVQHFPVAGILGRGQKPVDTHCPVVYLFAQVLNTLGLGQLTMGQLTMDRSELAKMSGTWLHPQGAVHLRPPSCSQDNQLICKKTLKGRFWALLHPLIV